MKYTVEYSKESLKFLKKIDKSIAKMLFDWIEKNLDGCENPRFRGKGLTANHSGKWRYRIENYRILAEIQEEKIVILILEIGHRSEIYS
jgi:mRNA interferase RelE/StbE